MDLLDQFSLKVRRGDGAVYAAIRRIIKGLFRSNLPVPSFLRPVFRVLYELPFAILFVCRWALNYFYREPAFRSRCTSVGRNLSLWLMPDVRGHTKIYIGNDVNLFGHLGVGSGRIFDNPTLIIGDRVDLGHNVIISVNREVVIEEEVNIASNVTIQDNDGHPRDPELRAQNLPPLPDEIKPVRICRRAWIGQGCFIMKGVTIGEGAIIGANSVVLTDVPPFCVALGNPARVVIKDVRGNVPSAQPASSPSLT
jgi:acetyltransferase-like isoleucine patch superfamily enzyme